MRTSGAVAGDGQPAASPLAALRDGLRFVFRTPIMVWTTGLDFVATFFAGSLSLLPIVADQVLHVGPAGYGWLVAAPALGALVGSLYTSLRHAAAAPGSAPARLGRGLRPRDRRLRPLAQLLADVRRARARRASPTSSRP